MEKSGAISYVLVVDVSDTGNLYYYTGIFDNDIPINTINYIEALKMQFKDECEILCNKLNDKNKYFLYHVEEHGYF